jgi:acyl-CoA synthetase (AMP-forming)/AMP-acid ligase II
MRSFSPIPAIDESFGLASLIDYHAVHNADRPFAVLAPDELCNASQITFLEFGRACQRFACSMVPHAPVGRSEVVGLIINCDTIMYVTAIAGLIRAGLTVSSQDWNLITNFFPDTHLSRSSHFRFPIAIRPRPYAISCALYLHIVR